MSSRVFNDIMEGMEQAVAFARGEDVAVRVHIPTEIDTKRIRKKLGLTQKVFAERYGFPLSTLRGWEQGRFVPDKATQTLLRVIDKEPEAVQRAIEGA
ncbi:MAG: type II toxin-antitoxin system MqsA family antitoxin [Firmicutes bacterium]|nr:type II toxin-antitoxin system MqsA family antitoxin [Bacillota bacterium]